MTNPTAAKQHIELVDLSLQKIFPFKDFSPEDRDDTEKVNQAYRQLFEELIPGFDQVQFVLAEVLEIDRKESASRLLVYSALGGEERSNLIRTYKDILASLKDVSPVLISESDAFYLTSRIWCAEAEGIAAGSDSIGEKQWSFQRESITTTGMGLTTNLDLQKEEQAIESTFRIYVEKLHEVYLRNYPYAYVLLVPIFLNSMSSRRESLQKLGAVFLHFTSTQRVDYTDLRRIYSRILLFWHYYFTSEAIDKRQSKIKEQEARAGIYTKIEPYLNDIRKGLLDIRQPLRRLEAELSPVKGLLLGGDDISEFFSANGRTINLREGLPAISPRHDWIDGDVETYKLLVAGVLIRVLHLEAQIPCDQDLWQSLSGILCNSQELVNCELLRTFSDLESSSPNEDQVKRTYRKVKSWFSDSYKRETAAGLPLDMLEFALRVWEADVVIENDELSRFWVASRHPVQTIDALGMLNAMYRIRNATVSVTKTRSPLSNAPLSYCQLKLGLAPMVSHSGSLSKLSKAFSKSIREDEVPRGDMTRFLWTISGQLKMSLNGTRFIGQDKKTEGEVAIAFVDRTGPPRELTVTWRGRIEI